MTLSDLEADARGQIFRRISILHNTRSVWPITTKFSRINRAEEDPISRWSATTLLKGASHNALQFFKFPSLCAYILWRRTTKFDKATRVGRGLFLGVINAPTPWRLGHSALSNLEVLFYLDVRPLSQKCQIWRGNTNGEGLVLRGQPCLSLQDSGVPGLPNFRGSAVFMFTPFNEEGRNSAC